MMTRTLVHQFSPEDKILLACARQTFTPTHCAAVQTISQQKTVRWDTVFRTARLHGISPLVFANLQQCNIAEPGIPADVTVQFKRATYSNVARKERRAERLRDGLAFFVRKSIPVMLIKGGALDTLVYDKPWYTIPHDIDLVLQVRQNELLELERAAIARYFSGSGIEFDYYEHHDVVMNGALRVDFRRVWGDARQIDFRGQAVWVMSPEDMLLAACINSCRKRFFRLKSLCDIAEIIERVSEIDWGIFGEKARAYDSQSIVYAALLATNLTVGSTLPETVLPTLGVSAARKRVLNKVITLILKRRSFADLYPFSGRTILGRQVTLPLLLTYATYNGYQIGRKMGEIYHAWRPLAMES